MSHVVSILHDTVLADNIIFLKPSTTEHLNSAYEFVDELDDTVKHALVHLKSPIPCPLKFLVIASKLDIEHSTKSCRLAFSGNILTNQIPKIFRWKERRGLVDKVPYTNICHVPSQAS